MRCMIFCSSTSFPWQQRERKQTFVTSYILSWLDYCNCLLMGTPNSAIQPLQKVQNFAARLILMAPCYHHSTTILQKLHWLPISQNIKYKVASMRFHAINGSSPTYLFELLHVYTPSCTIPACSKSHNTNTRLMAFALSLTLDPVFGIHSHTMSGNAQLFHLLKRN